MPFKGTQGKVKSQVNTMGEDQGAQGEPRGPGMSRVHKPQAKYTIRTSCRHGGRGQEQSLTLEKAEEVPPGGGCGAVRGGGSQRMPANVYPPKGEGSNWKARNVSLSDRCQCGNRGTWRKDSSCFPTLAEQNKVKRREGMAPQKCYDGGNGCCCRKGEKVPDEI